MVIPSLVSQSRQARKSRCRFFFAAGHAEDGTTGLAEISGGRQSEQNCKRLSRNRAACGLLLTQVDDDECPRRVVIDYRRVQKIIAPHMLFPEFMAGCHCAAVRLQTSCNPLLQQAFPDHDDAARR